MVRGLMDNFAMANIPHGYYSLDNKWRFTYINHRAPVYLKRNPDTLMGKVIWEEYPYLLGTALEQAFLKARQTNVMQYIRPFTIREMRHFCILAQPAASGLHIYIYDTEEQATAGSAYEQISDKKSFLLRLSDAIRFLFDPLDIKEAAIKALGRHLHASRVIYGDITALDGMIYCALQRDYHMADEPAALGVFPLPSIKRLAEGLVTGRLTIVYDVRHDHRWGEAEMKVFRSLNAASCVNVPIFKNGNLAACLCVFHAEPRWWSSEEIFLIEETAERTFTSAERAQAEISLRESQATAMSLVEELEASNRNKNEFLSTLSHELRNPLAAISVGLDLVESAKHMDEAAYAIDIMKRQTKQLCHLVDDLLEVTRISNNKILLKKEKVELIELSRQVLEDMRPQFEKKKIGLNFYARSKSIDLYADPVRLRQMICNLLSNALKFTDEGGAAVVTVFAELDEVVICVEDNGIGIQPQMLPQLFQPFKQVEASAGRSRDGLGLGLSIVKGIVALHGGSVSAHSDGLGQGARFLIRLPAAASENELSAKESIPMQKRYGLKVLLVEDQHNYAHLLGGLCMREGYVCHFASTQAQIIAMAEEHQPDVIVCDIDMVCAQEHGFVEYLRREPNLKDTKMVALTSFAKQQKAGAAMQIKFDRYFAKPIDVDAFMKFLYSLCTKDNK